MQSITALKAALARAKERADQSRTDAEYEANRQVIIWLEAQLSEINQRAA